MIDFEWIQEFKVTVFCQMCGNWKDYSFQKRIALSRVREIARKDGFVFTRKGFSCCCYACYQAYKEGYIPTLLYTKNKRIIYNGNRKG